ncbi:hypothetical protein [Arcticibacter sp.]|jgi:hypothetical protein|uniref:hypothetical protein n=1 Tax=Arcticibacter sp. TaxID=1872630 RepID=UPI00388F321D
MKQDRGIIVNILNRNYPPCPGITGESAAELAAYLVGRGLLVNIITVDGEYQGGGGEVKSSGNVYRIKTFYNGKSKAMRLLSNLYEGFSMVWKSRSFSPDVTICMTDPPLLNMWAAILLRKRKWILWAMDLYPEAFAAAGLVSKGNVFYKLIDKIVLSNKPSHIISLGPYQNDYLHQKYGRDIASTILPCGVYNAADQNHVDFPSWAKDRDKIYLGYCGNLGEAHSLEFLMSVIDCLDPTRFRLILALYGAGGAKLAAYAEGKQGVEMVSSVKRGELKYIDIHLASLKNEWVNVCVPSKTVSSVCSHATFIYCGSAESDNWELLKGAGWLIPVMDDVKRSAQEVLTRISKQDIVEKKGLASELAKVLLCKKEAAFKSIYEGIVEIAPRSR